MNAFEREFGAALAEDRVLAYLICGGLKSAKTGEQCRKRWGAYVQALDGQREFVLRERRPSCNHNVHVPPSDDDQHDLDALVNRWQVQENRSRPPGFRLRAFAGPPMTLLEIVMLAQADGRVGDLEQHPLP